MNAPGEAEAEHVDEKAEAADRTPGVAESERAASSTSEDGNEDGQDGSKILSGAGTVVHASDKSCGGLFEPSGCIDRHHLAMKIRAYLSQVSPELNLDGRCGQIPAWLAQNGYMQFMQQQMTEVNARNPPGAKQMKVLSFELLGVGKSVRLFCEQHSVPELLQGLPSSSKSSRKRARQQKRKIRHTGKSKKARKS